LLGSRVKEAGCALSEGGNINGSLYRRDGNRYVPTALTTGPWRPDAMHGGAPSALIGYLVSGATEEGELVARVQIDLEQPVPLEPLRGTAHRRQISKRVAHLDIELHTGAARVVSAKALLMRQEPVALVAHDESPTHRPDQFSGMDWSSLYPGSNPIFVRDAVEHRIVRGGYGVPLPSAAWLRLTVPVVHGHQPCALSQLLAIADFGSPLSQTDAIGPGLALINVDVNVTLFREPVGPWFYVDGVGHVGPGGIGLAVSQLSDYEGMLGVITQSQIARRYSRKSESH
jgi:Thioesterase-like superfamily